MRDEKGDADEKIEDRQRQNLNGSGRPEAAVARPEATKGERQKDKRVEDDRKEGQKQPRQEPQSERSHRAKQKIIFIKKQSLRNNNTKALGA